MLLCSIVVFISFMSKIIDLARRNAQSAPQVTELLELAGQGRSTSEVKAIYSKKIESIEFALACVGLGYLDMGFTNPVLCITGVNLFKEFMLTVEAIDLQDEDAAGFLNSVCQGTFLKVQESISKGSFTLSDDLSTAILVLHEQLERVGLLFEAKEFEALGSWDKAGVLSEYLKVRSYFRTRLKYGVGGMYFHQNGLLEFSDFEQRWSHAVDLLKLVSDRSKTHHQARPLFGLFATFLLEERASCEAILYFLLNSGQPIPPDCVSRPELEQIYEKCLALRQKLQQTGL
jgi:hypothetical protein